MFYAPLTPRAFRASLAPQFDRVLTAAAAYDAPSASRMGSVREDEQAYTFELDVPGVSREQLNIGIEGKVIRVETLTEAPRQYKLACTLPQEVDVASSEARLEHGVLTVRIAKKVPVVSSIAIN